jgi:CubicO group peptidase (beta-lactamase class C family)
MKSSMTKRSNCIVWMMVSLVFFASSGIHAQHQNESTEPSQELFPKASAQSQGMSQDALDALARVVEGYYKKNLIVGAELLVIKNRRTVLHEVFGLSDREQNKPMVPHTLFNIRSMTKPLTGAAIQILIDRGELKLDDRASKYLKGFDNDQSREITIELLLTHRSGLPLTVLTTGPRQFTSLQAIANTAGENGPEFTPDSKFWYSDAGSDALGAIVEAISGLSLDEFWNQYLLGPLGMDDTFCAIDNSDPRWDRLVSLYLHKKMTGKDDWFRYWKQDDQPFYPFAWGSQSLYSTPMDYARFLGMWMDDGVFEDQRILSSKAVARTLWPESECTGMGSDSRAQTGFGDLEVFYGQLSVIYMNKNASQEDRPVVIGHSGSDGTWAWAWPEHDLMVLYFTQSRGQGTGLGVEMRIDKLLIHPLFAEATGQPDSESMLSTGLEGDWDGKIQISKTRSQNIIWRFELSNDGELVGYMGPASFAEANFEMQEIVVLKTNLGFNVKSQGGRFKGSIFENQITGNWFQKGRSVPMTMAKRKLTGVEPSH